MGKHPKIISTLAEALEWRHQVEGSTVGFVPTMGALHQGHAALLREIRPRCQISVLSIFVNPTQFAPHEDLDRYPRSFENDVSIAASEDVDVVFAPTAQELYPLGFSTFVEESRFSAPFCGSFRPGHFRGVTTIVLKLLNLLRPQLALFGLKDAQQFFVLKQMVKDLNLNVTLEGIETIRERDGLALSSRNIYLSSKERELAPLLYRSLLQIRNSAMNQDTSAGAYLAGLTQCLQEARETLTQNGFRVQYLDCRKLSSFDPLDEHSTGNDSCIVAGAAILGKTRLIDNVILNHRL